MQDNIKLGDSGFDKMLFILEKPITKANHKYYRFDNEEMQEITDGVWSMPAYMKEDDDYSLFFIFTQIESGETVVAFSEGHLDGKQFRLSTPMPSGEGLNHLVSHDEETAGRILHFLNQISKAAEGNWRMVQ
ncbi:hypothetical protein MOO44_05210 [Nicoliella spurrieriana]|uniref:Uncharacterized protein n=1 Tax=Nicoliella spurrieriana TaxID=2925830 RepID=A0A976X504_9LACO|nr:hypothetical protein [Nicoliella spurrieriana]UQS86325.1 hypothetical protein MOO44_05210 [Nicoliella spurrieriana]